jgi:hypothetical protein
VTGGYGWQKLERVDDERLTPLGYSTEQRFGGSLLAARRGEQTTSFVALGVEAGAGFSF